jgi:hypothetical protein
MKANFEHEINEMRWMELCALSGKCVKGMGQKLPRPFQLHFEMKVENLSKFQPSKMRFECSKHVEIA